MGRVLAQSARDTFTDHVPQWAAAVAYYALLSVFPLLLATIAIAAYFVDPSRAEEQIMHFLGDFVPQGRQTIRQTIQEAFQTRGSVGVVSVVTLLWTGSRVFGILTTALNVAYDAEESYGFWKRLMVEIAMTVGAGLLFLLALVSGVLLNGLRDLFQAFPVGSNLLIDLSRWLVAPLLLLFAFFLIYRFVPRGRHDWRSAMAGAAAATLLFIAARPLFFYYIHEFSRYNLIYGSLAIVIILLVWAWIMALITLFGGELASHIEMMFFQGQSAEEVKRKHDVRSLHRKPASSQAGPPDHTAGRPRRHLPLRRTAGSPRRGR